jgi:hypothetical protein
VLLPPPDWILKQDQKTRFIIPIMTTTKLRSFSMRSTGCAPHRVVLSRLIITIMMRSPRLSKTRQTGACCPPGPVVPQLRCFSQIDIARQYLLLLTMALNYYLSYLLFHKIVYCCFFYLRKYLFGQSHYPEKN